MSSSRFDVRLLSVAEEDLSEAITFIAADNPAAAKFMVDKMENTLADLAHHPRMGREPDDPNLMELGYRYLIVDSFLVFYVIEATVVIIHRIRHRARDYGGLL